MSDQSLTTDLHLPAVNLAHIIRMVEEGEIITRDGEILAIPDADNESLIAWAIMAQRLRKMAYMIGNMIDAELLPRAQELAGPIHTEYGTAKESVSRGTVSGAAATRVRAILEAAAEEGELDWDVVENLAPLQPHVTPARLAEWVEAMMRKYPDLTDQLASELPEKRRSIKITEA